jgi:hypothetical protein
MDHPSDSDERQFWKSNHPFWLALILISICALQMIWPGDAPWICDEPLFVGRAQRYNRVPGEYLGIHLPFTIAPRGLLSNRQVFHGPLPIWIYQVMLLVSHDPIVLVAIRAFVMSLATAGAMIWLGKTLRLNLWLVPVAMLSPWFWLYDRVLWDTFAVPLSALLLASYAAFLQNRRGWMLCVAILSAAAMPLAHLMTLAISGPFLLHLLLTQWTWLWKYKFRVAMLFIAIAVLPAPYWIDLIQHYRSGHSAWGFWAQGLIFPLLGVHHLSAAGVIGDFAGTDDWIDVIGNPMGAILNIAMAISCMAYLASWIGFAFAIPKAVRGAFNLRAATTSQQIALLCLGIWLAQTLLAVTQRVYGFAVYHNATWIVYFLFAWWTFDRISSKTWQRSLLTLQAAALATVTITMVLFIHANGGTRYEGYGATLANQMSVEESMEKFVPSSPQIFRYPLWSRFTWAPQALWELRGSPANDQLPQRILVVDYVEPNGTDAHIELRDYPMDGFTADQAKASTQP